MIKLTTIKVNSMKQKFIILLAILLPFSSMASVGTPTDSLREAVNGLLKIAANNSLTIAEKKGQITTLVEAKIDLQVVSQRVVLRAWRKATKEQKKEFVQLFTKVVVNTYFSLLQKYTDEKIDYLKEEVKRGKFAKVYTKIILSDKTIPVNYKLILRHNQWRLYDFSAEGISLISTYSTDYKTTLRQGGLAKLNAILKAKLTKKKI